MGEKRKYQDRHRARLERQQVEQARAFQERLAGLSLDRVLIGALDMGKNVHVAGFQSLAGRDLVAPREIQNNAAGFAWFTTTLDALVAEHQPQLVILGHEPTGVYHEAWARQLLTRYADHLQPDAALPFLYRFVNPYAVKLERQKLTLRPHKDDWLDLAAIIALLRQGLGRPAYLPDEDLLSLCQEVGFLRAKHRDARRLEGQLIRHLDRLWPGAVGHPQRYARAHPDLPALRPLVRSKPLARQRVRLLIEHLPNPYDVRRKTVIELRAFFQAHGLRCGEATAQAVLDNAQAALLPSEAVVKAAIPLLQRDFRLLCQLEDLIAEAQQHLTPLVELTPARHLVPIPGLSVELAAKYLAVIRNPANFDHPDQVWTFVGFDVVRDDSGDARRVGHLTKRGDPYGRAVFYQLGYQTALHYPPVSQVFFAALARGKSETEATLCAAHKAHRLCFRLLQDDRPYEDRTTPADWEAHRQRWAEQRAASSRPPTAAGRRTRRRPSRRR